MIKNKKLFGWLNITSGIELWHRGMVGGVVSLSSIVKFEAKRVWIKMSFPVRNRGSEVAG